MLFRKLWRTIGLYKAQFISMMIMIALGLGVFVGFHMEWVSIRENTNRFYEETGFADERIVSEQGFSADDVQKIAAIPGVRLAARFVSAAADVAGQNGDTVTLTVTENPSVSGFALISGEPYDPSDSDGIWLSDRYAAANGYAAGDPISLIYKDITFSGVVRGLIKSSEYLICVRDETQLMDSFDSFMEIMNTMIFVLVFGAVLLDVVVLYNLGVMSYTERYREMATLKVVGFKDRKIAALLVGQNLWLSAVGILIGLPFGMGVLEYMLKTMASEYELKMTLGPLTYSVSILLTFAVSMVVSLLVARKNRKIDMVEALKCAE